MTSGMLELSRYCFLLGALPFLILGAAHVLATPISAERPKGLSPSDSKLTEAMTRTRIVMTGRTNMWLAWVGFNLSHSLGAILFGVVVLLIGRDEATFRAEAPVFVPLALGVASAYLVLGVKYWFRTPIGGIVIAVAAFACSLVVWLAGR